MAEKQCNLLKNGGGMSKYSTSEVLTGDTWIDGKPIYRKAVQGTFASTNKTWRTQNHGISGIDAIINYYGYILNDMSQYTPLNYVYGVTSNSTIVTDTDIGTYSYDNTRVLGQPMVAIIEYTKQ